MSVVGEATIKLNFDGSSLTASAQQETTKVNSALSKLGKGAKVVGGAMAQGLAIGVEATKAAVGIVGVMSATAYRDYEQLAGGMQKIFDGVDYSEIANDAYAAYETMNISANEYMENISGIGAVFSQTMGDAKGYETAKAGMQALADYASGTGKSVDTLMEKYQAISRSTSSYLSIADQFAGLLPQTTDGFLKEAQASGLLSKQYTRLNQVPVAEYQQALTKMLEKGVDKMGLAGNTAMETAKTISGSLAGMKSSWKNLLTGLADPDADLDKLTENLVTTAENLLDNLVTVAERILPSIVKVITTGLPKVLKKIVPIIKKILPDLMKAAVEMLVEIIKFLPQLIPVIVEGLKVLVVELIPHIPEILAALIEALFVAIVEIIGQLGQMIGEAFMGIFDSLGSFFEGVFAFFGDFVDGVVTGMTDFVNSIGAGIEAIGEWFRSVFQGIWDFVTGIFKNIANFFKGVWDTIASIFNGIGQAIGDAVSGAFKATVNGILGFIEGFVNTPINILNGFIDAINAAFGFVGVNLGKIGTIQLPRMAQGGFVNGAVTALIGEAGNEAVIPLERNTDNWTGPLASALAKEFNEQGHGGANGITIYMTNNINSNLDADEIGQRLMTSIRRAS